MNNYYAENKSKAFSAINVVPLIGVLAALLVVVMMSLPSLAQEHSKSGSSGTNCYPDLKKHILKFNISDSGVVLQENRIFKESDISSIAKKTLMLEEHAFDVHIDVASEASYNDVMALISNLQTSGIDQKHIHVLNNYD
jgi:biopolymer transport protein ExbD